MARKLYTEEQLRRKVEEELNKAMERREQWEREDKLYRRINALEERIFKLEHPNAKENEKCDCCCEPRPY